MNQEHDTQIVERFAVTGAGGFVGGQLVSQLLKSGHEVIAIVRRQEQGTELEQMGAIVRVADIRNQDQIEQAIAGSTGVFHLAALFNNPDKTWEDYREVNVQGSLNVLAAASNRQVKRVVHCSTVGVATEAEPPPYSEKTPYSPQPDDKYEVSKCEAEQAVLGFAAENDISVSVIRPAQVYGPGDKSKVKFYKLVKKGIIVSPGRTRKHLIYIDDLCRAFELAMLTPAANNEIFLIAGNESTALKDLVSIAADILDVPYPKIRLPAFPVTMACAIVERVCNILKVKPIIFKRSMDFFTRTVECKTEKANTILGFESRVAVKDGVESTIEWYRKKELI
jgi:nucleoside-diphosphate-sugar epimerase